MPHWNGFVDAEGTPPHLVDIFKLSPSEIEQAIAQKAAEYENDTELLAVSWEPGKWNRRGHVTVGGTNAQDVLEYFGAKGMRPYKTSKEKDREREAEGGASSY